MATSRRAIDEVSARNGAVPALSDMEPVAIRLRHTDTQGKVSFWKLMREEPGVDDDVDVSLPAPIPLRDRTPEPVVPLKKPKFAYCKTGVAKGLHQDTREEILDLYNSGKFGAEISNLYGLTRHQVNNVLFSARKAGDPRAARLSERRSASVDDDRSARLSKIPIKMRHELFDLREAGATPSDLAVKFGLDRKYVSNVINCERRRRLGRWRKSGGGGHSRTEKGAISRAVTRLFKKGMASGDIAKKLGLHPNEVYWRVARENRMKAAKQ